MNIDEQTGKKIQELQVLEQNLQTLMMQKQTFQVELNEITNALLDLKKSDDEVYKMVGGLMVKTDKTTLNSDLEEKKKLLEMRISSVEKQEKIINGKSEEFKKDINDLVSKDKK